MKYLAGISIGATALALVCSLPGPARSQDFPNRAVTVTIPYAPGGSAEGSLRPVADALSKTWKQPVIVESKAGGGTTIGAGYIAEQKPDGQTQSDPLRSDGHAELFITGATRPCVARSR